MICYSVLYVKLSGCFWRLRIGAFLWIPGLLAEDLKLSGVEVWDVRFLPPTLRTRTPYDPGYMKRA